jgi:hypothetical protein
LPLLPSLFISILFMSQSPHRWKIVVHKSPFRNVFRKIILIVHNDDFLAYWFLSFTISHVITIELSYVNLLCLIVHNDDFLTYGFLSFTISHVITIQLSYVNQ